MAEVSRHAMVPYAAHEMFALVDDIRAYPSFLPWCREAVVHSRTRTEVEASLELNAPGMRQRLTTRNTLVAPERIDIDLISGPFRRLQGVWQFRDLDERASRVSLHMEFEMKGIFFAAAMTPIFGRLAGSLVEAFHKRAEAVHGERTVD